jgi:hypothetical protein
MKKLWKSAACAVVESKPRFVIADDLVSSSLGQHAIIMLSDLEYWSDNYEQLHTWCQEYSSEVVGMTVNIPDDRTLTAFCLRWS